MVAIMTTSGAVLVKAGANVSAVITADAGLEIEQFISEAESLINVVTRVNYSDSYSGLNADVKQILNEVSSALAAMSCIMYDMSGYTSRYEAETMLDVLRDSATRGLSLLRGKKRTDFIDGA